MTTARAPATPRCLALLLAALIPSLIGCAAYTVPPAAPPSVPAARPSAPPAAPATLPPTPAVVDSAPSPEALEVLSSIPDPLTAGERVPPPEPSPFPPYRGDEPAPRIDGESGEVPVPAATVPLGRRRRAVEPDTSAAPLNPPPASGAPADSSAADSATPERALPVTPALPEAAEPDSCWRIQIAAPTVRDEAEGMRAAGESQLLLPMVIEVEAGRYKVRSAPCMNRAAVVALRERARAAGFEGAFPVLRPGR